MFSKLFKMAGPGFTAVWCVAMAMGLAMVGLVIYILILAASYLTHHI